ncbi:MAG: PDGLE domain-containing protein [Endomicrobiales bacterium]
MRVAALGVVLVLAAVFLAPFASPLPDGLEKVAQEKNFAYRGDGKALVPSFMADYLFPGVENRPLSSMLTGLAGSAAVFFLVLGAGYLFRRKGRARPRPGGDA